MPRVSASLLLVLAALGQAGCYGLGRYALPISLSNEPGLYAAAFSDAVTFQMVRALTGQRYEEVRAGDTRYAARFANQQLCKLPDLPNWTARPADVVARGEAIGSEARCSLAGFATAPACRDLDGCTALVVDPAVLARYRAEIVTALSRPCDVIDQLPDEGRPNPAPEAHGPLTWNGARRDRGVLRCGSKSPIAGRVETIDPDSGIIVVRF